MLVALVGCDRAPAPPPASLVEAPVQSSPVPVSARPSIPEEPSPTPVPAPPSVTDALALLRGIGDPEAQATSATALVAGLSPEALRAWISDLSSQPFTDLRDVLLLAVFRKLAETAPLEALQLVVTLNPPSSAEKLIRRVADVSVKSDYWAVFEFGTALPNGPLRDRIRMAAIRYWSDQDPVAAFKYLSDLKTQDVGALLDIAGKRVALRDPEQAFDMLDLIKDPEVWRRTAGTVFHIYAEKDSAAATELFLEQADVETGISFGYALGSVLANKSVPEGIAVLNRIENDRVADHFIHGMIHRLNRADMTPLLDNISNIENSNYRQITAEGTARDLSKTDPVRATDWIATISDDDARARAYQGAAMGYAEKDSRLAERWLQTLPAGKDRRYAIFGFAMQNAGRSPEQSAYWALQIAEPEVRERLLKSVLSRWSYNDQAQAQSWASSAGYENLLPPTR